MGGGSRRWLGLVALTIGVAMIIVGATIVNVAIPSIIRDLGIGITLDEESLAVLAILLASSLECASSHSYCASNENTRPAEGLWSPMIGQTLDKNSTNGYGRASGCNRIH